VLDQLEIVGCHLHTHPSWPSHLERAAALIPAHPPCRDPPLRAEEHQAVGVHVGPQGRELRHQHPHADAELAAVYEQRPRHVLLRKVPPAASRLRKSMCVYVCICVCGCQLNSKRLWKHAAFVWVRVCASVHARGANRHTQERPFMVHLTRRVPSLHHTSHSMIRDPPCHLTTHPTTHTDCRCGGADHLYTGLARPVPWCGVVVSNIKLSCGMQGETAFPAEAHKPYHAMIRFWPALPVQHHPLQARPRRRLKARGKCFVRAHQPQPRAALLVVLQHPQPALLVRVLRNPVCACVHTCAQGRVATLLQTKKQGHAPPHTECRRHL